MLKKIMQIENVSFKGFILSLLILIFLCVYAFLHEQSAYLQQNFKQTNIFPFDKKITYRVFYFFKCHVRG